MKALLLSLVISTGIAGGFVPVSAQTHGLRLKEHIRQDNFSGWLTYDSSVYIYNNPQLGYNEASGSFLYDTSFFWDNSGGAHVLRAMYDYAYNNDGYTLVSGYTNILTTYPSSRTVNTYNTDNKLTTTITYTWDGVAYAYSSRITYTYNTSGALNVKLVELWGSGAWEIYTRTNYSYDTGGHLTLVILQKMISGSWVNQDLIINTYSPDGDTSSIITQTFTAGAWKNENKHEFVYTAFHKKETDGLFSWNGAAWTEAGRTAYTYDADQVNTVSTFYRYVSGAYEPSLREIYTYNAAGQVTLSQSQSYSTGVWKDATQLTNEYNAAGYLTYYLKRSIRAGVLTDIQRVFNTYEAYGDATGAPDVSVSIYSNVFPNPFAQNTILTLQNPVAGNVTVNITDITGKLVSTQTAYLPEGSQSIMIEGSDWPAGMYLACISSGTYHSTLKLVKQ